MHLLFRILYVHSSLALHSSSFSLITFFVTLFCQLLCLFLAAHTPDNSFMGFVAEELNETERLNIQRNKVNNMAVVYGKEASMWKVSVVNKSLQQLSVKLGCICSMFLICERGNSFVAVNRLTSCFLKYD